MITRSGARKTSIFFPLTALAAFLAFVATAPRPADAQPYEPPTISVAGHGEISVTPDMATVRLGVTAQSKAADAAVDEMSTALAAVLDRLAEADIAPADIRTGSLRLSPNLTDYSSSRSSRIDGFTASSILTVRVRDLDIIGEVLDAVIGDGANELQGIEFGLQDPEPVLNEARREAVANGRAKAELFADAAGVALGELLSLSEAGAGSGPPMPMMEARVASVPVAEGEIAISADVSMVFQVREVE
ncbi:hypothetical protein OG2516_15744 [Oceanicola granulosus HTCC2516]|uniref:Outer membrane protein, 28Kda n=1 Tax=Oceanicola granulosus (strain ATCC BAA-861 / DSM 15982 / KCTC 12143 / HTCC2516) TaxID=314256 RepID=Q2CBW5_OCEGH|nr:SIMPL domain-containing protein [Oceanicola granulosus]EAR50155.1 hypothetical protein OG2516_15744 [Oceanicola granulosus HTCC2516]